MIWAITGVALLLIFGPLRPGIFRAWRFVLPAAAGAVIGFALAIFWTRLGLPSWMLLFGSAAGALIIGAGGKAWLDQNLGPPKN